MQVMDKLMELWRFRFKKQPKPPPEYTPPADGTADPWEALDQGRAAVAAASRVIGEPLMPWRTPPSPLFLYNIYPGCPCHIYGAPKRNIVAAQNPQNAGEYMMTPDMNENPIAEPVWQRLVAAREAKMAAELTIVEEREKVATLVATQARLRLDDEAAKADLDAAQVGESLTFPCKSRIFLGGFYAFLWNAMRFSAGFVLGLFFARV